MKLHPDERRATVTSSNGEKEYTVSWDEDGAAYSSNDNATYWQGYAGYPVIAVLMEQGELPLDRAAAEAFAHVDWTDLNERFKHDYAAAVAHVVADAASTRRAWKPPRRPPTTPWPPSTSPSSAAPSARLGQRRPDGEVFATRTDEASKVRHERKPSREWRIRYTDRDGNGSAEGAPWPTRNAR